MGIGFIWFLLIGLAAGWMAGYVMKKSSSFGVVSDIVIGVIGALIGGSLVQVFNVPFEGGLFGSLIVATMGAIVLLFGLRMLKKEA
jgi:uncharacterized membrane protein YeaQ/YmgE (transglycosylase-associated protein family)